MFDGKVIVLDMTHGRVASILEMHLKLCMTMNYSCYNLKLNQLLVALPFEEWSSPFLFVRGDCVRYYYLFRALKPVYIFNSDIHNPFSTFLTLCNFITLRNSQMAIIIFLFTVFLP